MTRDRTVLCGRRDGLSREGGGNRDDIAGLIFRLEEAETRCYRLTDDTKASRFELRTNEEVKADLRRALESKTERRGRRRRRSLGWRQRRWRGQSRRPNGGRSRRL